MKTLLTLVTLALAFPALAQAECWPSLHTCSDPAWVESDCAADPGAVEECRGLLEQHAFEQAELAEPDYVDGEWHYNQHMDFAELGVRVEGNAPIYADELARIHAEAAAIGGLSEEVLRLREGWATNGEIQSCEEYVHEKYLGHAQFEDSVAHIAAEPLAILEAAAELGELSDALGAPLPEPAPFPPSPYLQAPIELLAMSPELEESFELMIEPVEAIAMAPSFEGADVQALEDARMEALRFEGLLSERAELDAQENEAVEAIFAGDEEAAFTLEVIDEERRRLDEVLTEELVIAQEMGCLNPMQRCDLAPSLVAEHILTRFDATREADYRACKEATKGEDGFGGLRDRALYNLDGSVMYGGINYIETVVGLSQYILNLEAWHAELKKQAAAKKAQAEAEAEAAAKKEKEKAAAKAAAKAALAKAGGGLKDPMQSYGKDWKAGNSTVGARLRYKLEWRLFGFENVLCNVNAKFEALLDASVTVFKKFELFYARFYVTLHRYEGDLRVLGGSVYKYKDHRNLVGKLHFNLAKGAPALKLKEGVTVPFTIVFIPASIKAGIAGKLGIAYSVDAGIDKGGAACAKVDAYVKGTVKPFMSLDGFAEFAVDIWLAKGGVGGKLQVLSMALPMNAKVALSSPQGAIDKLALVVEAGMDFTLSALKGSLYVFGQVGWCPFCLKGKADIFKWKGITFKTPIFKTKLSLPVWGLQQLKAGS